MFQRKKGPLEDLLLGDVVSIDKRQNIMQTVLSREVRNIGSAKKIQFVENIQVSTSLGNSAEVKSVSENVDSRSDASSGKEGVSASRSAGSMKEKLIIDLAILSGKLGDLEFLDYARALNESQLLAMIRIRNLVKGESS